MLESHRIVKTQNGERCPRCHTQLVKLPEGIYICGYSKSTHFDYKTGDYECHITPCIVNYPDPKGLEIGIQLN